MINENEVNNQVDDQEEELDYFLPEGYDESEDDTTESEEEVEEVEETEEATEEESEETDEEETEEEEVEETVEVPLDELEIKFLKETKQLKDMPREEIQTYLQKGMNYDRVQEKLNTATETVNELQSIAEMFEMDVDTVIETLKNQHFNNIAEEEGRKAEDVRREYEADKKDRSTKMYERFVEKFPDADTNKLPEEVLEAVRNGEDLTKAFERYSKDSELETKNSEIETLKAKLAEFEKKEQVKTQNSKTKKKSVVKKTSSTAATKNDDFLDGFLED